MNTPQPSLKINFGMNAILTVSSIIFPIITFPYISRVLLPVGTGKVSFALSFVAYFTMIAELGIPTYGIRACARVRDDRRELSRVAGELLLISLIMSAIAYAALYTLLFTVPRLREDRILFIVASASIILDAVGMEWLYRALEQYTYITVRSILFKLISIAAMFLLIHQQSDYVIYAGISVFAGYAANLINLIQARRFVDLTGIGPIDIRKHLKPVFVFFAMSCATTVYLNLDTVMLGFMTGDEDVGYYNAAVKIKSVLVGLITSLGGVLLPRVSYYVEQGERERFRDVVIKAFRFVTAAAVPLMVYFILFAPESIRFLSGDAYSGAINPMRIIMPTLLFIGITNVIGIQIFIPLGKEKTVLVSELAGAVIDIIINLILIPVYRSSGAAAGTVAAEFAVLLVQAVSLKKLSDREDGFIKLNGLLKDLHMVNIILATAAASFLSILVKKLNTGLFFTLLLSAAVFFGVYSAVFILSGGLGKTGKNRE